MKRVWIIIGRISYIMAWPALYFYLKDSQRTRVIVRAEDKVLLLKDWLGDGKWKLPGGGVHQGENIAESASRELFEETGVEIRSSDLKPLGSIKAKGHGTTVVLHIFESTIPAPVTVKKQKLEIVEAVWQVVEGLADRRDISDITRAVLSKAADLL